MISSMIQFVWIHLIQIMWLALLIYWVLGTGGLKAVERRESQAQRVSHLVPMLTAALLLILPERDLGVLAVPFMERTWTGYSIGVVLVVLGCAYAILARRYLGANWSGSVTLKQDHSLVQSGPYRYIRHPIYTGLMASVIMTVAAKGTTLALVGGMMLVVGWTLKARFEERFLAAELGAAGYATYRARVPMLLPFGGKREVSS